MDNQDSQIRSAFRGELGELREILVQMAAFVESMLAKAMEALVNQDYDLAEEVRLSDDIADRMDLAVEELAVRLLALQQPLARDLRAITAALRMTADLERVGDYAKDIAKVARRLKDEPYHWPLEDIPTMGTKARAMVRDAMKCFVDRDLDLARDVARRDDEIDALLKRLSQQLMDHMRADPANVYQATYLLLVARYLERIGDHTVNVVERVSYIETGRLEHLV